MKRLLLLLLCFVIITLSSVSIFEVCAVSPFSSRLTAPAYDKYYKPQSSYNPFSVNYAAYGGNCTWYAWGRAYEITGTYPKLSTGMAAKWWEYNKSGGYYFYDDSTPKLGAIACWNGERGHVAVVEEVYSDGSFLVSESGWSSTYFRTTIIPASGKYPKDSSVEFQGFIYLGEYEPSAPTYAIITTDHTSYEVDETVTFTMESNGNLNTLWIYCPDGSTLHYSDVGLSYQLGFGMSGHYQALVQTWNGVGSFTSDRIDFYVGKPTKAFINTNKICFNVDETVYFTFDTDGITNTLWIYCPDGSTLHYSDVGLSYQLGFGMSGHYQALVQTWNGIGNNISSKIDFYIGKPTKAIINTNKISFEVDETVHFTFDTDGTINDLWVYCPDGETLSFANVGNAFDFKFSTTGEHQALVQTWNGVGFCVSDRIAFSIKCDHAFITNIIPATCVKEGSITRTCSCGYSESETIQPLGHDFENGVCTICGERDQNSTVIGDANGDGVVNMADSVLITRRLAGWNVEVDSIAADMDGDGVVDTKDVIMINRKVSGWNLSFN